MADILKVNINGTVYNIGKSYGTGNATTLGLTKLYTSTGTSTDGYYDAKCDYHCIKWKSKHFFYSKCF